MNIRDEKLNLYLDQLQKIFPGIDFQSVSSMYNGEEPTSAEIILSNISDAFKKTFKLNKHTTIIHYTSIETMLSILSSESFRLYNCLNLNDPKEIEFANNKFSIGLTTDEIKTFKRNNFIGSFCEYDLDKNDDNFNLWRLYGNNGNGAALVFEVENMEDSWENFFIGKLFYDVDGEGSSLFKEFIRFHKEFNAEHQLFENTPYILSAISLHFKDKIWKVENEFRLFTSCPFDEYTFENKFRGNQNSFLSTTVKHTVNRNGDLVSYISLPFNKERALRDLQLNGLSEAEANELFSSVPHLKLKKIILGYNISSNLFNNIDKLLEIYKEKNKQKEIYLEYSGIRKKFFQNEIK